MRLKGKTIIINSNQPLITSFHIKKYLFFAELAMSQRWSAIFCATGVWGGKPIGRERVKVSKIRLKQFVIWPIEAALNYILQNFESIIMEKYKDEFLELTPEEFAELLSYDELNIRSEGTFSKSEKSDFFSITFLIFSQILKPWDRSCFWSDCPMDRTLPHRSSSPHIKPNEVNIIILLILLN